MKEKMGNTAANINLAPNARVCFLRCFRGRNRHIQPQKQELPARQLSFPLLIAPFIWVDNNSGNSGKKNSCDRQRAHLFIMLGSVANGRIRYDGDGKQYHGSNNIKSDQGVNDDIHNLTPFARKRLMAKNPMNKTRPNIILRGSNTACSEKTGTTIEAKNTRLRFDVNSDNLSICASFIAPNDSILTNIKSSLAAKKNIKKEEKIVKYSLGKVDRYIEGVGGIQLTAYSSFATLTYGLQPGAVSCQPLAVC